VHVLSLSGGAWNFGASIMSFLFPMILFVLVASALYVAYTKLEVVPGHGVGAIERPVSYTAIPRPPETAADRPAAPAAPATAAAPAAAAQAPTAVDEHPADAGETVTAETGTAETGTAETGTAQTGEPDADETAGTEDSE
jgi:hypothetical protein